MLPRLRRFAHALSRNAADADDLTQATIERALKSQRAVAAGHSAGQLGLPDHAQPVDRHRAVAVEKTRPRSPEEEGLNVGEDPRESIDAAIDLRRVMAAMARLPDEQREVVALILIEGFGYKEVSEMLGLPIGTVSSRLVRGRTALVGDGG